MPSENIVEALKIVHIPAIFTGLSSNGVQLNSVAAPFDFYLNHRPTPPVASSVSALSTLRSLSL